MPLPHSMRCVVLLAVFVALAACQSAPDETMVASVDLAEEASTSAPEASGGRSDRAIPVADVSAGMASPTSRVGRELVKTGRLTLRAESHARAVAGARAAVQRLGGTVTGEESTRYATRVETALTLRVPAARFDTLLAALAALPGTVDARSVTVEDVTRPVADTEARLRVRRAAEERLVDLLDDAESVEDVLAVQTRLDAVREEIESAEASLRVLRADVAMSTVHATVYEESAAGLAAGPSWGARAGRALGAGWSGLLDALLVVAALWPLWLVAAAVGWALRVWRRRRPRPSPTARGPSDGTSENEPSPRTSVWT